MATATPSPPYEPDPFDLGIYTPKNLTRGARAALLRDSSPVETTDIGVSPARGRTAQTPSSPLTRMCNAAIAEGQQLDEFPALPTTVTHEQRSPIDITDAANQLVDEQVAAYNAKLRVFRTFCAHFNAAAKEFTTGPERDFAKHFSSNFLKFWKQALTNTNCASAPTYLLEHEIITFFGPQIFTWGTTTVCCRDSRLYRASLPNSTCLRFVLPRQ
ncbi:hypothetical protein VB005_02451 [Metarhizium brunneum]